MCVAAKDDEAQRVYAVDAVIFEVLYRCRFMLPIR